MVTLYYTVGLPGSGKTTWAREFVLGRTCVRVNRDDLRQMLHQGVWSPENERMVVMMQEALIYAALEAHMDVVVDGTNLNPTTVRNLHDLVRDLTLNPTWVEARPLDVQIKVVSFLHVPKELCILRDRERPNPVGEQVILDMWEKWLATDVASPADGGVQSAP